MCAVPLFVILKSTFTLIMSAVTYSPEQKSATSDPELPETMPQRNYWLTQPYCSLMAANANIER